MAMTKKEKKWLEDCMLWNYADKTQVMQSHIDYMLNRTKQIFKYDGLPETLKARYLEEYLQTAGVACIARANDNNVYAFFGGYGGARDAYYEPTEFIVANPYLNLTKTYTRDVDCVVGRNDDGYVGLLPLFRRFATGLAENELTINMVDIFSRVNALIDASNDNDKKAAQAFIDGIKDGKFSAVASNAFLEGIRVNPLTTAGNNNLITNLIELEQYLNAGWFNAIGLNANYNMKRESINSNESQLNDDMLKPLIDNMFDCRKEMVEKTNNMFDLSVSVDLDSSWLTRYTLIDAEVKQAVNESAIVDNVDNLKGGVIENEPAIE